ncbi:SGNH/GDSL hydrolase family protein [Thorsellia kenyensis]|uniref:GDSL-type esterase/lipase family protein n=1 Tax=Thorsellia kenyensis TaxID=1549888 RepID=A0ABV6CAC7_9GAMM
MPRSNNVYDELREMLESNQSLLSDIDKLTTRDSASITATEKQGEGEYQISLDNRNSNNKKDEDTEILMDKPDLTQAIAISQLQESYNAKKKEIEQAVNNSEIKVDNELNDLTVYTSSNTSSFLEEKLNSSLETKRVDYLYPEIEIPSDEEVVLGDFDEVNFIDFDEPITTESKGAKEADELLKESAVNTQSDVIIVEKSYDKTDGASDDFSSATFPESINQTEATNKNVSTTLNSDENFSDLSLLSIDKIAVAKEDNLQVIAHNEYKNSMGVTGNQVKKMTGQKAPKLLSDIHQPSYLFLSNTLNSTISSVETINHSESNENTEVKYPEKTNLISSNEAIDKSQNEKVSRVITEVNVEIKEETKVETKEEIKVETLNEAKDEIQLSNVPVIKLDSIHLPNGLQIYSIIRKIDSDSDDFDGVSYELSEFNDKFPIKDLEIDTWIAISSIMLLLWFFIWFNQNSINIYFQQKYHKQSPIEILDGFQVWHFGQNIHEAIENSFVSLFFGPNSVVYESKKLNQLESDSTLLGNLQGSDEKKYNQISHDKLDEMKSNDTQLANEFQDKIIASSPSQKNSLSSSSNKANNFHRTYADFLVRNIQNTSSSLRKIEVLGVVSLSSTLAHNSGYNENNSSANMSSNDLSKEGLKSELTPQYGYVLEDKEKVFFIGDSLMQGVAPYVMNRLKSNFDVDSINLSKQSTGLTYNRSFNWLTTIEKTLSENPDIGLLVVMLGANDPWSMRVGKGEPYLKFNTPAWDDVYLNRIQTIYQLAAQRNIGVVWVGAPLMKEQELSQGVTHLNTLYKQISQKFGGIYLDSNVMFSYQGENYDAYAPWQGNAVKVRANDGVHFTPRGQKIIAEYILSLIGVKKTVDEATNNNSLVDSNKTEQNERQILNAKHSVESIRDPLTPQKPTQSKITENVTNQDFGNVRSDSAISNTKLRNTPSVEQNYRKQDQGRTYNKSLQDSGRPKMSTPVPSQFKPKEEPIEIF